MKKPSLLLLLTLLISSLAMAQTGSSLKPSFGVRGGLSSASMKGEAVNNLQDLLEYADGNITTHSRTGYFAGAYVNLPLTEGLSVEPGVYYTQKGYEMRGKFNIKGMDFLGINGKAQLTSQYIDMPLLLKGSIGGFEIFGGPQLSYLAKANLRTTAGALGFNMLDKTMDATEQFNRWDAGLTGGIGYQFPYGINVRASYDYGMSKADANKRLESYNRSFKVGVGLSF
ncbi:porin family protein [Paraflavisolibacter sp. H34]|uniref:porin family protein n=1 Tax=Huijunlia imazamoxiresistens TaxID=3127457 RepID=UPI0030184DF0